MGGRRSSAHLAVGGGGDEPRAGHRSAPLGGPGPCRAARFRLGWIDSAGTGLFVVYKERQSDRLAGLYNGLLERTVSIKLSRVRRLGNGFAG